MTFKFLKAEMTSMQKLPDKPTFPILEVVGFVKFVRSWSNQITQNMSIQLGIALNKF